MGYDMKNINKKYIWVLGIIVLFCAFAFGCTAGHKEISISNYAIVNIEGLSGRANATLVVDYDGIYSALAGINANQKEKDLYNGFVGSLSFSLDKYNGITNGDKLTLSVTYDDAIAKELKLNVTNIVRSYNITELYEGTEIDVFKDLSVIVSGVAPYATATFSNDSDDPYIKTLSYEFIGDSTKLSNGDTIVIKCNIDPKDAELYYYYTDRDTMSYTVSGLDTYITNPAELDYTKLNEIAADCADTIVSETEDTTTRMLYKLSGSSNYLYQDNHEKVDKIELRNVDFLMKNAYGEEENVILFIFYAVISNNNYTEDGYFIFKYQNALKDSEGNFYIGTNSPELRYDYGQNLDELYSEYLRDYSAYDMAHLDGVTID